MAFNRFVWSDLSTYDMQTARSDYSSLFSWRFSGDDSYAFAELNGEEIAGIFPMPERLAKINMPSFWMSYIRVANLDDIVAKAKSHEKVIIEIEPQAFGDDARIALVRDPSGAGFTLYQGPEISSPKGQAGQIINRYHHLADVNVIKPFYEDLFGWQFSKMSDAPWPVYEVKNSHQEYIATVEEVPEEVRGKYSYWMPCFGANLKSTDTRLNDIGAKVLNCLSEDRKLVADRQGAHFLIKETNVLDKSEKNLEPVMINDQINLPWKAILGLCGIWLAFFLNIPSVWGVIFLVWVWPMIKSGRADFLEPISRKNNALVYWLFVSTWVFMCVYLIIAPLIEI